MRPNPRTFRRRGHAYARRAFDGLARVLMHELDSACGHLAALRERLALAGQARGLVELVQAQVDLLPETRARLELDQRERLALLRSWLADLRGGLKAA